MKGLALAVYTILSLFHPHRVGVYPVRAKHAGANFSRLTAGDIVPVGDTGKGENWREKTGGRRFAINATAGPLSLHSQIRRSTRKLPGLAYIAREPGQISPAAGKGCPC